MMMMLQRLALLMLIAPTSVAACQESRPVFLPGAPLRWAVEDTVNRATNETRLTYREGRLDSLDGHSLVFMPARTRQDSTAEMARGSIARMVYAETLTGYSWHAWEGGLAGLAVGATVGYLLADPGAPTSQKCSVGLVSFCQMEPARESNKATRTALFGVGGALAGAVAGHFIRTENWTPVAVADLRRWLHLE